MLADGDEIGNGGVTAPALSGRPVGADTRGAAGDRARHPDRRPALALHRPSAAQLDDAAALARIAGPASASGPRPGRSIPRDFATTDPALIARRVLARCGPARSSPCTTADPDRWATVQAIPRILAGLARRGYQVTTVTELSRDLGHAPSSARRPGN